MQRKIMLNEIVGDSNISSNQSYGSIAIIGIAFRLPFANNQEELWRVLSKGANCITETPQNRKIILDKYLKFKNTPLESYTYQIQSYIDDIDKFDYSFFNLTPREAELMHPDHKLFLQVAYSSIEDAGYGRRINGTRTGVYVGYSGEFCDSYKKYLNEISSDAVASLIDLGNKSALLPARLSKFLNLKGPSMLIDTTCSSSLTAVHMACNAIRNGDCDMAIVGGSRINLFPIKYRNDATNEIAYLGQLIAPPDGITRSFDDDSIGTVLGEGAISIVLKSLKNALDDSDNIYGIIKGSAINNSGKTADIAVPDVNAQQEVLISAWKSANVDPQSISYIEAHGTATKLGDPIEIEAISKAFTHYTQQKQFCAIGSYKSNVGHLDNMSGLAGLLKLIISLKNRKIPPSINFDSPNRYINFATSPVYVNTKLRDWDTQYLPRKAGVNSIGVDGTNVHVVLEEYIHIPETVESDWGGDIFTLSAKTKESLIEYIKDYIDYLQKNNHINVHQLCHTLNNNREHFNCRIAFMVCGYEDMINKIKDAYLYINGIIDTSENIFYSGSVVQENNFNELDRNVLVLIKKWNQEKKNVTFIRKICEYYTEGAFINWNIIYNEKIGNMSLPTYHFERKDCFAQNEDELVISANKCCERINSGLVKPQGRIPVEDINHETTKQIIKSALFDILGYTNIDDEQNFFDFGLKSISTMLLLSKLKSYFDLDLHDIAHNPSIDRLSEYIITNNRIIQHTIHY